MSTLARTVRLFLCVAVASSGSVGSTSAGASSARTASGDGKIAFVRSVPGRVGCAILAMNADGSDQRRLTSWNASCSAPAAWSPDGRRLAFYARGALWVMNADGTRRSRLSQATYPESGAHPGPSFSPDGARIVFTRNPSSQVNASAIYVIRADGVPRRLTRERFAYDPLWSPRGDVIAFRSERDNDDDIYLMRSDGSRQRRLTRNRAAVESLVWSPDGRFIAYAFYAGAIYRAPTSGSPRRLLAHVSAAEPGLSWSPDERYLAYENDTVRNDIYVMTAKGFDERRLTKRFFNFNPSWSPDSRRIAHGFFTRLEGPSRGGIAVIHADGSNRRELTTGNDSFPSWQPVS